MAGKAAALPCDAVLISGSKRYYVTPDGTAWSTVNVAAGRAIRLKGTPNSRGYIWVRIDGYKYALHILVCTAFHGPKPFPDAFARHIDDIQTNNAKDNLTWGTALQNSQDRARNGNVPIGINHGLAILTDETVAEIRALRSAGVIQREVARRYGVHPTTIRKIEKGLTWQHVKGNTCLEP